MGSVLMLCGLAGVLFGILYCDPVVHSSPPVQNELNTNNYAVVLDCDDNKTTAFIYKWGSSVNGDPVVELATDDFNVPLTKKVFGGIARFALNATSIYSHLDPLIKWAKHVIPEDAEVSIHAKVRDNLLTLTPWERFRLINPINSKLQSSGFRFKGSFVGYLPMEEQAVFSLQSVNYFFGDPELATYGSLILGKHAISKAYLPMAQAYASDINIGARLHDVTVKTSYHVGMEDIRNKFDLLLLRMKRNNSHAIDPCLPKGTHENVTVVDEQGAEHALQSVGSGDFQHCSNLMSRFFYIPAQQSYDGLEKRYVAVDKYNMIKMMFGLDEETSVADLKQKVEAVCNRTWERPQYHGHNSERGGHHASGAGHHWKHNEGGEGKRGDSVEKEGERGGRHHASGGGHHWKNGEDHNEGGEGQNGEGKNGEYGRHHRCGGHHKHWKHGGSEGSGENQESDERSEESEGSVEKESQSGENGRHHRCGGHHKHWKHGGHGENATQNGENGENRENGHRRCHGRHRNWWLQKCFVGTYTVSLLEDMYGFTNGHSNDKIIWKDVSWTYGYVLSEVAATNSRPISRPDDDVQENITGVIVLLVSTALMLVGLIFFMLERRIQYMPLRSEV